MRSIRDCTARIVMPNRASLFNGEVFLEFRSAAGRVTRTAVFEAGDTGFTRDPFSVLESAVSNRFTVLQHRDLQRVSDGEYVLTARVVRVPRAPRTREATREARARQRRREQRYSVLRREFLMRNRVCVRCNGRSEQVHHARGREGENLFQHFIPVCGDCHSWIHANPVEATERGWLHEERIFGGATK